MPLLYKLGKKMCSSLRKEKSVAPEDNELVKGKKKVIQKSSWAADQLLPIFI